MSDHEVRVDGLPVDVAEEWRLEWDDRQLGVGRLIGDGRSVPVLVEGRGSDWVVTLRGRRIPVTVRSWRERILVEAEGAAHVHAGPIVVNALLPGLVAAVAVSVGDTVEAGAPLLTIEAMKMQNEVRAPRAGTIIEVAVTPGMAVATGATLIRLE